jgi:plastocyanin
MRRASLALILSAALFAGCDEDEGGSTGSTTVNPEDTVVVAAREYGYEPGTVRVRKSGLPQTIVRLRLRNDGSLPHDIQVRFGGQKLVGTKVIGDGETAEVVVSVGPGSYELFCSVGDHEDLGMRGKLEIE